jgi:ABC-type Fe3+/spermidine/putrescine transport system ATPase subunit
MAGFGLDAYIVSTQSQLLIDSDKLAECVFKLLNIKDLNARTVLRQSIEQQLRAALVRAMANY